MGLAHDAVSDFRYLNRGTRGSTGRLPIEEVIAERPTHPDRSFMADFRMHRESILVLVDLLPQRVRMINQLTFKTKLTS